ncbi:MAG TPA: hypothetical protein VFL82_01265, partial [Thermomicrobiales bacterium]|nr:hypothetical protein [Thermomicrobiales bacterium]
RLTGGKGTMHTTDIPATAATTTKSIRYRIGAMAISAGQRIAGVEIRPRSLDDSAQGAIHGAR